MEYHFNITVNGREQNFLSIKETNAKDLIISPRGERHVLDMADVTPSAYDIESEEVVVSNMTIHPNLKSEIGSITINYKNQYRDQPMQKQIAGVLGLKMENRLFPVIASIGRNVGVPSLTVNRDEKDGTLYNLWEESGGINLSTDSLAYSVIVANPKVNYVIPEDFPRNVIVLKFTHFQILFLYWLFPKPTMFRGSTIYFTTSGEKYEQGFEFHEVLNFTNDITQSHMNIYGKLPPIKV